jgi:hypothetical protein
MLMDQPGRRILAADPVGDEPEDDERARRVQDVAGAYSSDRALLDDLATRLRSGADPGTDLPAGGLPARTPTGGIAGGHDRDNAANANDVKDLANVRLDVGQDKTSPSTHSIAVDIEEGARASFSAKADPIEVEYQDAQGQSQGGAGGCGQRIRGSDVEFTSHRKADCMVTVVDWERRAV